MIFWISRRAKSQKFINYVRFLLLMNKYESFYLGNNSHVYALFDLSKDIPTEVYHSLLFLKVDYKVRISNSFIEKTNAKSALKKLRKDVKDNSDLVDIIDRNIDFIKKDRKVVPALYDFFSIVFNSILPPDYAEK